MTKKLRKPLSIILSLMMVLSALAMIPLTASAVEGSENLDLTKHYYCDEYNIYYPQAFTGEHFSVTLSDDLIQAGGDGWIFDGDYDSHASISALSLETITKVVVHRKSLFAVNNTPVVKANGNSISYTQSGNNYTFNNINASEVEISANPDYPGDYFYCAVSSIDVYYTAPTTYTVTWKNWDGTELEKDENVVEGATTEYNGATPTKPEDDDFTYEFAGWTPEVAAVTADTEYTATFTAVPKYEAGYYVIGTMTNWKVNADYQLTENTEAEVTEYIYSGLDLTTESQFKVVYAEPGKGKTWFPDPSDNYGANGEITKDDTYTVYFRPDYNGGDDWFCNAILAVRNIPAESAAVIAMINALPDDVTVEDKDDIEAARAAYEALNDDQKSFIDAETLEILETAERDLEEAEDQEAADAVSGMIDELPSADEVTVEDKEFIEDVRAAYDELTDEQKALVDADTLAKLTAAEQALAAAEQAAANQAAADEVAAMMNALPDPENVTVNDENAIAAAGYAYAALTNAQKALIDPAVVARYRAVAEAFAVVAEEAADQEAAAGVTYLIDQLPDEITENYREAVENARKAYDMLTDAQKALISDETLAKLEAAEKALVPELVNESYIEDDAEEIELGNRIKVCGAADGGTGEYTFAFYYKKSSGTEWLKMTADSNGTSASFKPGKAVSYDVKAVVTDSDECSAEKIFTVSVKNPLVNKSELITTATVGEKIILKGAASGGAVGYTYAFYYKKSSSEKWLEVKPAYTTKSASFKPGKAVSYDVMAVVKDADGTTAEKVYTVAVKTPVVNKTTVNAETVKVGEKIVLKGAASGGSKSYTYAFYYKKSTSENWVEMTAPYTSKSCAFKPGKAVSYDVKSIVKDSDGRTAEVINTVNVTK